MRKIKTKLFPLICSILLFFPGLKGYAEKVNFEFIDQKYGDILYALSAYRGIPIVSDDTITGNASFQFAGTDFEKAFEAFLNINRLYVEKKDSMWTISKISIRANTIDNSISIDAFDVNPAQILDRLSQFSGKTIIYDILPASKISIHISAASTETVVELVMKPFSVFSVEVTPSHLYVKKNTETIQTVMLNSKMYIEHSGDNYTAEINQAKTSEIIERLCREEKMEYSNFIKNDPVLSGIKLTEKTFDEIMSVVLEQAGAEKILKKNVMYFLPAASSESIKKIRESSYIWKEFCTHSIRSKDALNLITARFPGLQIIQIPGSNTFFIQLAGENLQEINEYITQIDKTEGSEIMYLKYISTTDLFKSLPPSVKKEELIETGTGNSFFYNGPDELKNTFINELKEIDKPKERIRYDMLIIQYENSSNLAWGINSEARRLYPGDMTSITGSFGSLMNLNFDVITLFGYKFSVRLNSALSDNSAHVFADTTLHGITGENIKFQNTSTYRYRDSNVDPETGKTIYTGITREIISGVVLDINGWVSGDGMVTMNIHASVSKRGVDVSGKSGNPPPTSEKSITTKLNTANGEPVILSGLTQNDSSIADQRIPFISRIPLLGWLFRSRTTTNENTEMVIYIVPHITNENEADKTGSGIFNTAYDRLVVPYFEENKK